MKKKNKRETPLEKLRRKRHELEDRRREEQLRIGADWDYLREHPGSLFVSGISYFFYPRRHKTAGEPTTKESLWQNILDNLPFYLAIVRESLSVIRYISRRSFRFRRCKPRRKKKP